MKFFVDTANIEEIEDLIPTGFVDGVTTNPSLIAKQGADMAETIKAICSIVSGPVSAEVTATKFSKMLEEGEYLASLAKNVAVKVPLTIDGLKTCKALREKDIMVNVTLCFSAAQALLAAKAGATFISPFVGRLDDIGEKGMDLIEDIVDIYENYAFDTEVLVASGNLRQVVPRLLTRLSQPNRAIHCWINSAVGGSFLKSIKSTVTFCSANQRNVFLTVSQFLMP